jgi:AcrR family transcriptional regulator
MRIMPDTSVAAGPAADTSAGRPVAASGPAAGAVAAGAPVAGPPALAEPRPSLRERKKLATRCALRRVALDLFAERGFGHVTVEDIAEAVDVSPRTFFNYFASKEAVLFGADPDRVDALRLRLIQSPPGESALDGLRAALIEEARTITADLAELGGDPASRVRQMRLVHADPQLRAARAAHMAMVEHTIAAALAERLGTDPDRDPYPLLLAGAAMGVLRATILFWANAGGAVPLEQLVDAACQALADGLPETCALRGIVETAVAAGPPAAPDGTQLENQRKDDDHR